MAFAFQAGIILCVILFSDSVYTEDITVQTNLGNITGEVERQTFAGITFKTTNFYGIPFAEPPIGTLRFNKPVEKVPFEGTFVAKTMSAQCVQNWDMLRGLGLDPAKVRMDEDCLYLNIFIPGSGPIDKSHKRAVMIWIYGGDFQVGSQDAYAAKAFVGLNDVVLVTLNYRVSLLGFLSSGENNFSGNYGLWDQHMAIKWVHNHIENFGGDPLKVTLFGESAGSASVIYQALYVGNVGHFQRVIAQSGSANIPWAYERNPQQIYNKFVKKSSCWNETSNAIAVIKCLRNLSIDEIQSDLVEYTDKFRPVLDGTFVRVHPPDIFLNKSKSARDILYRFGKLDIIIGVTSAEGGMFISEADLLIGANGTTEAYTQQAFKEIIVPFGIEHGKLKQSKTISSAILHQYFDWSEPNKTETAFHHTVDLLSDVEFNNAITRTALAHSDSSESGKTFFYIFDQKSVVSDKRLNGASHAEDIAFTLGFPTPLNFLYMKNGVIPQHEIELSLKLMKYWSNFAKTG